MKYKDFKQMNANEMKVIVGGFEEEPTGCGKGISCTGKKEGDSCGTKLCLCETRSSTDKTLYCSTQV